MDILQNIVYPQSPTNILLLKYLFFLTLLILLPYLGVLIGSTLFSVMHYQKGRKSENRNYIRFANELINLFTVNKGMAFTLGLVPIISLMFILAQLLLNSGLNVNSNMVFVVVILISSLIYIYTYKYSFKIKNLFNLVNITDSTEKNIVSEFEQIKKGNIKLLSKSGIIGVILLLFVAYLLIGILQLTNDATKWNLSGSLSDILFSPNTIIYYLFYLAFSISITCAAILYKYFKNENEKYDLEYLSYIKQFSLKTGLIFTFIQPLLYVITILSTSKTSLSFIFFVSGIIVLVLMLVITIMFYLMYKNFRSNNVNNIVFIFLILTAAIIYNNQVAFETASEKQIYNLENEYKLFASNIKTEAGISDIAEISGEDIFNGKCIACHKFDIKLVGPAYRDVLPKYEGKQEELIDFILNPRKINPEFTSMPSQGLKPKEAEAIANYIVKIYNDNK